MTTRRGANGRFASDYDLHSRYAAAVQVLRAVDFEHPDTVSTRRFDAARSSAGHSDLARADQLARSVGCSWPEFRAAALAASSDKSRSYGARHKEPPRRGWLTKKSAAAVLARVAEAMGRSTLTKVEFDRFRLEYLARTKDVRFVFPTSDQIIHACGGWLPAIFLAHLDAPMPDSSQPGLPVQDAICLFLCSQGRLPARNELTHFAADARWSFPLLGLNSQPWQWHMRDFRRHWVERLGRWAPTTTSRPSPEIQPLPAQVIAALPWRGRAPKNWWTYGRVIECAVRYFIETEAHTLKQAPYRAWAREQNASGIWTATASTLQRHGTLAQIAIAAREQIHGARNKAA